MWRTGDGEELFDGSKCERKDSMTILELDQAGMGRYHWLAESSTSLAGERNDCSWTCEPESIVDIRSDRFLSPSTSSLSPLSSPGSSQTAGFGEPRALNRGESIPSSKLVNEACENSITDAELVATFDLVRYVFLITGETWVSVV